MTHTYNITGITCSSCVAKVKSSLLKLGDVLQADVQLAAPQAVITMQKHIPLSALQAALGVDSKYQISEVESNNTRSENAVTEKEVSYYPIFLIFGYIAGITSLIQFTSGSFSLMQWMQHFMAGFFIVFSFFKMMNLKAFAEGYRTYDIVAKSIPAYGFVYPFIELILGIAIITGFEPYATNIVALVVMAVSTIGVVNSLLKKTPFQCACLGTVIKLPLSKVTLFEDLLMVVMSAVMLLLM